MFDGEMLDTLRNGATVDYFDDHTRAELGGLLTELKCHRGRLDAVEANVLLAINVWDKRSAPNARPSDTADDVTENTGESRHEANKKARRAELFDDLPSVTAALAAGAITAGHADLLAAIPATYIDALTADLADLLAQAAVQSVDEFAQTVRKWKELQLRRSGDDPHKTRRDQRGLSLRQDRFTGMTRVSGQLDPESGAIVRGAIERAAQQLLRDDQQDPSDSERRTHTQRTADALTEICRRPESDACNEPTVIVGIGLDDLVSGLDGVAHGAGPVSAETARKLAYEGGIIPLVLNRDSVVLDMGRRTRLATTQQRLALLARYGGCAVETCDRPFEWCHMHHIEPWESGGDTDLDNLIPVCTRHRHDKRLTIQRTNGNDHWTRPTNRGRDPDDQCQHRKDRASRPESARPTDSAAARQSPFTSQAAAAL
jgi:hypothetical protein